MSENFDHGYALLIGVGAHSYPSWSLPVTVKDVSALRHVLTHRKHCAYLKDERHMRLLCDERATRANILAALDDLAAAVAKDPVSTAVVYYSGHGCLQKDQKYFLVPHDVDPRKLAATALRAEDFTRKLRDIRAQRLLVILDTCYAE
ncbi:MAG TPA: caspase family protein, partial [Thermoanaerobaculia bacterium]|nr:caspase family protein [Thermoanaerobaculia bacterium]